MSQKIGRQDGIDWIVSILRKIPGVKYRPLGDRPLSLEQWYGLEKYERLLRILKDDHDAEVVNPPPPTPPDPAPAPKRYAPRTHNLGGHNQDPRFCTHPAYGVVRREDGLYLDEQGCLYDDSGQNVGGTWRVRDRMVPGLKGADSMDGKEPCEEYVIDGQTRPPYPKESFLQ